VGRKDGQERMKQEHVSFPCGNLRLEGIYFSTWATGPVPAVVLCHPHPLYGGSMHNNVTFAMAEGLVAIGISALLFNFRGVGGSGGTYDGGIGEQDDVRAALDYLQGREGVDRQRLGLAGYSFGGGVVLPVACEDERVCAFALVSPYLEEGRCEILKSCVKPKLIVGGQGDDVVTPAEIALYAGMAAEPKKVELVNGADHLWMGYEDRLSHSVAVFFSTAFKGLGQGI